MGYCVAVGCQSRSSRKHESVNSDVNISFYRLPSNPTLKKIWIQKIKREDFPTDESKQKNIRICHLHFDESCFKRDPKVRNKLKCHLLIFSEVVRSMYEFL